MSMMPNAMESIPDYQPAPPDSQPADLQTLLSQAAALIAQDRMFSPDEQAAVMNFLAVLQQIGQAQQQAQMQGNPQNPANPAMNPVQQRMAQGGFGPTAQRDTQPYGTPTNPNVRTYGG